MGMLRLPLPGQARGFSAAVSGCLCFTETGTAAAAKVRQVSARLGGPVPALLALVSTSLAPYLFQPSLGTSPLLPGALLS